MLIGLMFGRPALEPGNLITQSRHKALQLNDLLLLPDKLLRLPDNQVLQFSRRQAVRIVGWYACNESDSRNRGIL
jgi:hypothetical protein